MPTVHCSCCGRSRVDVIRMIAGSNARLCDRCVAQAARQLAPRRLGPRSLAPDAVRCRFCDEHRVTGEVTTVGSVIVCADCLRTTAYYTYGDPLPPGWRELTDAEERVAEDRFRLTFDLHRGFREPRPSVTYAIGHALGDDERCEALEADLASRLMAAFRRCCAPGDTLYVLDWQHPCYRVEPHQHLDELSPVAWPVSALPDGDYHTFVADDFRFGVYGHPWEETMCVFGEALLEALAVEPPQLFSQRVRVNGLPAT